MIWRGILDLAAAEGALGGREFALVARAWSAGHDAALSHGKAAGFLAGRECARQAVAESAAAAARLAAESRGPGAGESMLSTLHEGTAAALAAVARMIAGLEPPPANGGAGAGR